jgi:hypothetical protein
MPLEPAVLVVFAPAVAPDVSAASNAGSIAIAKSYYVLGIYLETVASIIA